MTPPCLTDYISIDSLQTFLDEASQQDGVALRLWSPQQMATGNSGWINDSWDNACQFHSLIRSYPSGQATCHQFFQDQADKIIKNKPINWHKTMCPTSLYIFGWPIYGKDKNILAIIFGGLVRDSQGTIDTEQWRKVKARLLNDNAVIQELENEFYHAPSFTKKQRKHLFAKWKLFCELLSNHLMKERPITPENEYWIEWLSSFHSCSTIAVNLTKIKKVRKSSLHLTIVDQFSDYKQQDNYHLLISDNARLESVERNLKVLPKQIIHHIPVNKSNRISLSFDKKTIKNHGKGFYWKISKNIISGILIDHGNKNVSHRKLLLERQTQVFKEVCNKAVTNLESMIEELFNQLRKVGVINIDFASFSEVIYFPDKDSSGKPRFSARVVYPKESWSENQRQLIEGLDLYADNPVKNGSTVYAFQKSRTVLDRNVSQSPTYVEVQSTVQSSLVIPIIYGPLVLGVIAFDSIEKDYFNDERKLQLENLTQLIAPIAYHNKFQETLQELNQSIKKAAREIKDGIKQRIRKHILKALCSLVQADAASYWEQDKEEGKTLYRGTSIGDVSGFKCNMDINNTTLGDLFTEKQPFVLWPNIHNAYKNRKSASLNNNHACNSLQYLHAQGIYSYLAFPVKIGGKQVIISFYRFDNNSLSHREFSKIELNITQPLGEILSFYESLNRIFDQQRSELELQLKSREELAITLAHNIKSPLSSTFARLDDLERRLKKSFGEGFHEEKYNTLFDAIKSNFFAIKRTTSPMLQHLALQESYNLGFFSVQAFHLYYDILTRQIARVRRGLKIENNFHKRTVELSGHRQFPLLYGDKSAIEAMMSNLLENAVKYSGEEDKLFIETNFDYVSREIQVLIKNEGQIYIPEEDKERIFEYAYRAPIARDKEPSSTGVGLYYSRYIAQQHGASLFVEKTSHPVILKLVIPVSLLYSAKKAEETLRKNTIRKDTK